MHDPMTVAFDIRWPFQITIWHVDPEKDGSDDSCGWSHPKLTDWQRERVKSLAWDEGRDPWFMRLPAKSNSSPQECECFVRAAFVMVARRLNVKITMDEATRWAVEMTHNHHDNFRNSLCFLPGYHSNAKEDRKDDRERQANRFFWCIARFILRERRPWWKHPRWHFWHWQIQVLPILHFKRWAFSRCCECGKGFKYGESPVTANWNSTGPLWFRSESGIHHSSCRGSYVAPQTEEAQESHP